MALNLLSDDAKNSTTPAPKKEMRASVAFHVSALESEGDRDDKKLVQNAAPAPVQKNPDTFTHPPLLTKGFAVNLLGADASVVRSPVIITVLALLLAAIGTSLAFGVWFWTLHIRERGVIERTQSTEAALADLHTFFDGVKEERKEIEARFHTIDTVRSLLASHIYWTRFFHFLEAVTIPDVYYTNLAVDPRGNVRLASVARDFSSVARQLLALEKSDDVETVRITKAATEIVGVEPGVQFDLEIAVAPSVLFIKE